MYSHRLLAGSLLVLLAVGCAIGQDYEDERQPPVRARPPRGPIIPNRAVKQTVQKTSTTEAPPQENEELEYEDELIEEEPQTTTTTTEAPKKGIRGGVVRPFRSNTDLIEALKRRRAQIANGGGSSSQSHSTTTTTSSTTESPRQGRAGGKSKPGKFSRGGFAAPSSTTEQAEEEQPAPRSRTFARGRRF